MLLLLQLVMVLLILDGLLLLGVLMLESFTRLDIEDDLTSV